MEKVLEICRELIRKPSVTPNDSGCCDFIINSLAGLGFESHKVVFGENDFFQHMVIKEFSGESFEDTRSMPEKSNGFKDCGLLTTNLYATTASHLNEGLNSHGKKFNLCFAGHTDVVPPGDLNAWSFPPFEPTVINERLYGRGAVDMKGGIAAFMAAVLEIGEERRGSNSHRGGGLKDLPIDISFLITSDEEGCAKFGTKKMLDWMASKGHTIDCCLVGEPSNPNIVGEMAKVGRRGSLNVKLEVSGIQGHVAYPERALNPLPAVVSFLSYLAKINLDNGNEYFQPSVLQITSIDVGNPVTNLIPAKVSTMFNIRFNNLHKSRGLINDLTEIKELFAKNNDKRLVWQMDFNVSGEAFICEDELLQKDLASAIKNVTGINVKMDTGGGTSDARFIKDVCPVIEFGLTNGQAHKVNEHVAIADLITLKNIYKDFILRICDRHSA